jgi:hypothetical protein
MGDGIGSSTEKPNTSPGTAETAGRVDNGYPSPISDETYAANPKQEISYPGAQDDVFLNLHPCTSYGQVARLVGPVVVDAGIGTLLAPGVGTVIGGMTGLVEGLALMKYATDEAQCEDMWDEADDDPKLEAFLNSPYVDAGGNPVDARGNPIEVRSEPQESSTEQPE